MNRRNFIRSAGTVTIGGMAVRGMGSPLLSALNNTIAEDRVLVIIQLFGGNDGLNTVIPTSSYSQLSSLRSQVLIPQNQVLPLSGLSGTGLHPSMTGMQTLWNEGKPDDAAPFYAEALRIYRASLGGDHSWVGIVLGSVAANELARGRPAAALEAADAALVLRRRDFGPDHWRTAMVESMRGEALGRLGRREEAEPELRRGHQALLTTLGPEHPITREAAARLDAFYDASPSASLR